MDGDKVNNWGPVFDDDLHQIDFPDGSWVKVVRYITQEMESKARGAAGIRYKVAAQARNRAERRKGGQGDGTSEGHFDSGAYTLTLAKLLVKDWSFTKPDGSPIPCTPEAVGRLPKHTVDFIMEAVDELNPEYDEEEAENLDSPSASSSEETAPAPNSSTRPSSWPSSDGAGKSTEEHPVGS